MDLIGYSGVRKEREKEKEREREGKNDHDGTRTHNLLIRSQTPYPLGHAATWKYLWLKEQVSGHDKGNTIMANRHRGNFKKTDSSIENK